MTRSTEPPARPSIVASWSAPDEPGQQPDLTREGREALPERLEVLGGEDRRRTRTATCLPSWTALNAARIATSVLP